MITLITLIAVIAVIIDSKGRNLKCHFDCNSRPPMIRHSSVFDAQRSIQCRIIAKNKTIKFLTPNKNQVEGLFLTKNLESTHTCSSMARS